MSVQSFVVFWISVVTVKETIGAFVYAHGLRQHAKHTPDFNPITVGAIVQFVYAVLSMLALVAVVKML